MENQKLTICFLGEAKKEDIFTFRWAKYFSDRGHNIHLISYSSPGDRDIKKMKVYIIKKKFPRINSWPFNTIFNLPFVLAGVKKIIKEIKPDIIHAQCVTSYGTLGSLLNFHPFVVTAYGSDILINPKKFLPIKWSTKYALKKADLITCDAEHMKEAIVKLNVIPLKIKIIFFGIDTQKFSPGSKDEEFKKELGVSDCKVVISLRGLEKIYDVETLIKSATFILKDEPNTKFIILGTGSQEEELKKLAESLGIKNNVKFLGFISNEKLPKYLRTSDIYVSNSLSDAGISSSTAEGPSPWSQC